VKAGPGATPSERKQELRAELTARRARLGAEERAAHALAIAERIDALPAFRDAGTVALYAAMGAEVDATRITGAALVRGARVVFPRAVPGSRRLAFARCDPADLVRGPFGAAEPPPGAPEVDLAEIGCVVLPGVAFSLDGIRLGRGGGHYDATLAAMPRAARVGVAFELQLVPALPREPHDASLDALVTEARTLVFPRESR
jgi:5-formyltetrahydrofolate cyclo-ligase